MADYSIEVIRRRYALVPRTLVFLKKDKKYLLIHKNKKDSYGYGKLNGAGGHIERGEDPYQSAKREFLEETGLIVGKMDLAAVIFIDIGEKPGIQVFVFGAIQADGEIKESEEGKLVWMTLEEIKTFKDVLEDVPMLINICNNHEFGKKPVFLKYSYDDSMQLRIEKVMD